MLNWEFCMADFNKLLNFRTVDRHGILNRVQDDMTKFNWWLE